MNISVVIPTHNRKNELRRAVQSVCSQTVLPKEIIVIDDGSNPAVTMETFKNLNQEMDIKILRNNDAMGPNHARNRGIKEASGEWIAFLDDDDEYMPSKIERVLHCINNVNDQIDLLYHSCIIRMINEGVSYKTKPRNFQRENDVFRSLLIKNYIGGTPMVIVKKEVLLSVGLFDDSLDALEDYELWLRLAKHGAKFHFLNYPLTKCNYITKKKSVSKALEVNMKSLSLIEQKYHKNYEKLDGYELQEHKAWKYDLQIHKTYLNKKYFKAIFFNVKALFDIRKPRYLLGAIASILGPKIIFKLRSLKG